MNRSFDLTLKKRGGMLFLGMSKNLSRILFTIIRIPSGSIYDRQMW